MLKMDVFHYVNRQKYILLLINDSHYSFSFIKLKIHKAFSMAYIPKREITSIRLNFLIHISTEISQSFREIKKRWENVNGWKYPPKLRSEFVTEWKANKKHPMSRCKLEKFLISVLKGLATSAWRSPAPVRLASDVTDNNRVGGSPPQPPPSLHGGCRQRGAGSVSAEAVRPWGKAWSTGWILHLAGYIYWSQFFQHHLWNSHNYSL